MLTALREAVTFLQVAHEDPMVQRLRPWRRRKLWEIAYLSVAILLLLTPFLPIAFVASPHLAGGFVLFLSILQPFAFIPFCIGAMAYRPPDTETLEQLLLVPYRKKDWFLAANYWPIQLVLLNLFASIAALVVGFLLAGGSDSSDELWLILLAAILSQITMTLFLLGLAIETNVAYKGPVRVVLLVAVGIASAFFAGVVMLTTTMAGRAVAELLDVVLWNLGHRFRGESSLYLVLFFYLLFLALAGQWLLQKAINAYVFFYSSALPEDAAFRLPFVRSRTLQMRRDRAAQLNKDFILKTLLLTPGGVVSSVMAVLLMLQPAFNYSRSPWANKDKEGLSEPFELWLVPMTSCLLLFLFLHRPRKHPIPVVSGFLLHRFLPIFLTGGLFGPAICCLPFAFTAVPWALDEELLVFLPVAFAPLPLLILLGCFPILRFVALLFLFLFLGAVYGLRFLVAGQWQLETLPMTIALLFCTAGLLLMPTLIQRLHDKHVLWKPLGSVSTETPDDPNVRFTE